MEYEKWEPKQMGESQQRYLGDIYELLLLKTSFCVRIYDTKPIRSEFDVKVEV
jgi:hypothetical protein